MKKFEKKDRNEKRRVLLNKKYEKSATQTNESRFARPSDSVRFLKPGNDGTAARTPLTKRMLAVILAIVFVLTVVPTAVFVGLRGRAADEEIENLGPVTMTVIANGRTYTTAEVPAGTIADNLNDITFEADLPNGCQFEKALLVGNDGTETPISKVGSLGGKDYYSLSGDSSTGTALDTETQSLVLVYAAKYNVTLLVSEGGSAETNAITKDGATYIWGGTDLVIQSTPDTDYTQGQITYKVGDDAAKAVAVKDGSATISNLSIYDDIIVSVNFNPVSSYAVQDARYMTGSNYYPELKGIDNHGGTTQSTESGGKEGIDNVAKGGTVEFYIYSESNTGGNEWLLNMLAINGVDIPYPFREGNSVPKNIPNDSPVLPGSKVTVSLEDLDAGLRWKSGDYNWLGQQKERSLYKVTVTNVHENLEIAYHFKEKQSREIIMKDLRGIAETGAAKEERGDNVYLIAETRNYKLDKEANNVYSAYYNAQYSLGATWIPSANLYLYRVKPGFNPYSVGDNIHVDYINDSTGATSTVTGENALSGDSTSDIPVNVIKAASNEITAEIQAQLAEWEASPTIVSIVGNVAEAIRNWDSFIRFWGPSNELSYNNDTAYRKQIGIGKENEALLLQSIIDEERDGTKQWFAIALKQREETNQQLYLYATPYQYHVEIDLDLNSGDTPIDDTKYNRTDDYLVEKNYHTLENGATYAVMPSSVPTKDGYAFEGYQLYLNGQLVDETLYQANEQFPINETTIAYSSGNPEEDQNHVFSLKAKWTKVDEATTTKTSVDIYVQVPADQSSEADVEYDDDTGKYYKHVVNNAEETQVAGTEAILLDRHEPNNAEFYEIREDSIVAIDELSHLTIAGNVPDDNRFVVHWDIVQSNLSVTKEVVGRLKTTEFPITVTLTPPDGYPFTLAETRSFMSLSNNEALGNITIENGKLVYTKTFVNGAETVMFNAPGGWTYTVEENVNGTDFETYISNGTEEFEGRSFSGVLSSEDTSVIVRNQRKFDDPNLETDKWLTKTGEGEYDLTMEAYATARTITEEHTSTTPMDIALVIDQSGSMGNEDMNATFGPADKTSWTAKDVAGSDKTYYFKVGDGDDAEYYPVQSETGPLYESAGTVKIKTVVGAGHDAIGAVAVFTPHYSVPTNYYAFTNDGMHKVYAINVGRLGIYDSYLFYYKNESDARSEWYTTLAAAGWNKSKLTNDSTWSSLMSSGKVAFVDDNTYNYTWVLRNDNVSGLYKKTANAAPNRLYYVDDDDNIHYLSSSVSITESDVAYTGTLYQVTSGTSRVSALQDAVTAFVEEVAANTAETGVTHQISVIGFAGNETPGVSLADGIVNYSGYNRSYDYVNTGIFINGEFKNYKEITDYTLYMDSLRTNAHYYIDYQQNGDKSTFDPLVRIGEYWYRINNGHYYRVTTPSNYNIYEPQYEDLGSNYSHAFVDVTDNNGDVNQTVTDTIAQFGSYGGTYTSYGIAMANQVFENNSPANGRKRIVIVFTDGEPGKNGYDEAIAGEAKADAEITKTTYGADVYTVGLFVGKPSAEVRTFMSDVSSEKNVEKDSVYTSSLKPDSMTLDPNKTYYYYDSNNKKTYAVSTEYQGDSTLGWWSTNNIHVFPVESADDDDASHTQLYKNTRGTKIYADELETTGTYYILYSGGGTTRYIPVYYEYRWYDSDGYIVAPKSSANSDGYQFFEFGTTTSNTDGINYYLSAKDADGLRQVFEQISQTVSTETNIVEYNSENALLRDIITADFDLPNDETELNKRLKIEIVDVDHYEDGEPVFKTTGTDETQTYLGNNWVSWTFNSDGSKTLDITRFDYADNYVSSSRSSESNKGKKIVVTLEGLEPNKTGGIYDSNVDESGLYSTADNTEKFIDAFPVPSISRYEYELVVGEEDETASFNIDFRFQGYEEDGTPATLDNDLIFGGITFSREDGIANWGTAKADGASIIFEQILTTENNSGVKHGDNIPDNYTISTKVEEPDSPEFKYTMKLNNSETKSFDEYYGMPKSDATINISSTTKKYPVTIIKQVQPKEGDPDYTDKEKKFDMIISLYEKDGETPAPEGMYDGIEFTTSGGQTTGTISLSNDERETFTIPYGYYISVNEDDSTRLTYEDSYWEGNVDKTDNAETDAIYPITVMDEHGKDILVLNTLEAPDIASGVLDENNPFGIILAVLAGICLVAGGGTFYFTRRRKPNDVE